MRTSDKIWATGIFRTIENGYCFPFSYELTKLMSGTMIEQFLSESIRRDYGNNYTLVYVMITTGKRIPYRYEVGYGPHIVPDEETGEKKLIGFYRDSDILRGERKPFRLTEQCFAKPAEAV